MWTQSPLSDSFGLICNSRLAHMREQILARYDSPVQKIHSQNVRGLFRLGHVS